MKKIEFKKALLAVFVLIGFVLLFTQDALSWGLRGHHTVCEAASYIVKDRNLRSFLLERGSTLGHLCNVPDIYWRSLSSEISKPEGPTHYVDVELLGLKVKDVPLDYAVIIQKFQGQAHPWDKTKKLISIPAEFGSSWWRADQLYRRATSNAEILKTAKPPANRVEEQSEDFPFNKGIYDFFVHMGIMGHYLGDNAQPFHTTLDFDGWRAGHGGIHRFYETDAVAELDESLLQNVVAQARSIQNSKPKFLTEKTTLAQMRALAETSFSEISAVLERDPIMKKSVEKDEKGMKLREPAQRRPAREAASAFKPLIEVQMARAAALLAKKWDEAYIAVGKPNLSKYQSYRYPFTPEYLKPEYY